MKNLVNMENQEVRKEVIDESDKTGILNFISLFDEAFIINVMVQDI